MSKLSSPSILSDANHLVFIVAPEDSEVKQMLSILNKMRGSMHFTVFFWSSLIPSRLPPTLAKEGVATQEFNLGLVPIENDLLSLELHNGFSELTLNSNIMVCNLVRDSIKLLETLYGSIPLKCAKGKWSSMVHDSLPPPSNNTSQIDALLLLDREVDTVTPLLLQTTYEGLIDELLGISCGTAEFHGETVNLLEDPLFYQTCRSVHFNAVKTEFKKVAGKIESLKKRVYDARSANESAQFIKQIRDIKRARLETTLPLRNALVPHRLGAIQRDRQDASRRKCEAAAHTAD